MSTFITIAIIVIRHLQGSVIVLWGLGMDRRNVVYCVPQTRYTRKGQLFVMEQVVIPILQGQNVVPNVMVSILKPTCRVKDELCNK